MKAYYTVEVRDKQGKLLKREKRKSRSYVQQWNELIYVQCSQQTNFSIKDTGGVDRTIDYSPSNFDITAIIANALRGIVVGRGSTAVAIDDYVLGTICDEGVGANNLNYQACTFTAPSVVGSSCSFTVTRSAINNSGSAITITEIGIYLSAADNATRRYLLGIRDVLASSQAVPDGGAITVVYTIKVTV